MELCWKLETRPGNLKQKLIVYKSYIEQVKPKFLNCLILPHIELSTEVIRIFYWITNKPQVNKAKLKSWTTTDSGKSIQILPWRGEWEALHVICDKSGQSPMPVRVNGSIVNAWLGLFRRLKIKNFLFNNFLICISKTRTTRTIQNGQF